VIDWGLAAIGHPLFDLPAWPSWDGHDEQVLMPFLDAWRCSLDEWTRVRPLAFLFHAATAAHVADSMPSTHRRTEWAAGVQKMILRALAT
jgi:aminoglycoside phosphotransferase (APT) family kinase protein